MLPAYFTLICLLALKVSALIQIPRSISTTLAKRALYATSKTSKDSVSPYEKSRTTLLDGSKVAVATYMFLLSQVRSASAKVFIDTDLYGDKELKIATINKLKQKLRDAINKDITIAPLLFQIAINDALGYETSF